MKNENGKPHRVLVVDDSAVMRRALTDVLSSEPDIEVVGSAPDGRPVLAKIEQLHPDAIVLDVEMPEMDGLETLRAVRAVHRSLPVIMFSALTQRGARTTLDAIAAGASDYVTKPSKMADFRAAIDRVRDDLATRIRGLCEAVNSKSDTPSLRPSTSLGSARRNRSSSTRKSEKATSTRDVAEEPTPQTPGSEVGARSRRASTSAIEVLVIGCSTGGPNALADVVPLFPAGFEVPILIVQHMPPMFTGILAERLDRTSNLRVREARDGETVVAGEAVIAPGDFHLSIEKAARGARVILDQSEPVHSCRPAVDVLFRSAAQTFGSHTLGVVLTGMGSDGADGSGAIRAAGGRVLVQDRQSSVVWGMPGATADAGHADSILPLGDIANACRTAVARRPLASIGGKKEAR